MRLERHPVYDHIIVSEYGHIYSTKRHARSDFRELAYGESSDGYLRCKVGVQHRGVHRLVAETFLLKRDENDQVNHKDFNKKNNHISNLEWVSQQVNLYHCMDSGRHNWGRMEIRQLDRDTGEALAEFDSQQEASRRTGIAQPNINKVIKGLRPLAGGFYWKEVIV